MAKILAKERIERDDEDLVRLYLTDIGQYPLLTKDDEVRLAQAIEAGMIWVNSENNRHLPTPFGGMKASGIGRDGGDYSFDFYMETKNICLAHGTHRVPKLGAA